MERSPRRRCYCDKWAGGSEDRVTSLKMRLRSLVVEHARSLHSVELAASSAFEREMNALGRTRLGLIKFSLYWPNAARRGVPRTTLSRAFIASIKDDRNARTSRHVCADKIPRGEKISRDQQLRLKVGARKERAGAIPFIGRNYRYLCLCKGN